MPGWATEFIGYPAGTCPMLAGYWSCPMLGGYCPTAGWYWSAGSPCGCCRSLPASPLTALPCSSMGGTLARSSGAMAAMTKSMMDDVRKPSRIMQPHDAAALASVSAVIRCVASCSSRYTAAPSSAPPAKPLVIISNSLGYLLTRLLTNGTRRTSPLNVTMLTSTAAPIAVPHGLPDSSSSSPAPVWASGSMSSPVVLFKKCSVRSNSVGACSVKTATCAVFAVAR
mmetsp:Transcript_24801/g.49540  ORF Transcript_24801/g.49540 Transcript_24801/m.49540 type:complete len:226 (-) Transcript_24801:452-1129(-)